MTTRPTARPGRAATTAGALALALLLAGCGGEGTGSAAQTTEQAGETQSETGSSSPSASGANSPSPEQTTSQEAGTVVDVSIEGGEVSPKGERVPVSVGEPVTFRITSDVAGELHVHSTPESEIGFQPGTSEHEITVGTPGLVEVELHDPATTIVQLEAR